MGSVSVAADKTGYPGMMVDYATIEEASKTALIQSYECGGQNYECGGVIYEHADGRFTFTPPVTDRKPFGVTVPQLAEPPPVGARLVADYHHHICSVRNRLFAAYFSPADGLVDQGFNVIGYMLDSCTGNIHVFDPNEWPRDVMVVHFTSGRELELPIGHISGWIKL